MVLGLRKLLLLSLLRLGMIRKSSDTGDEVYIHVISETLSRNRVYNMDEIADINSRYCLPVNVNENVILHGG